MILGDGFLPLFCYRGSLHGLVAIAFRPQCQFDLFDVSGVNGMARSSHRDDYEGQEVFFLGFLKENTTLEATALANLRSIVKSSADGATSLEVDLFGTLNGPSWKKFTAMHISLRTMVCLSLF